MFSGGAVHVLRPVDLIGLQRLAVDQDRLRDLGSSLFRSGFFGGRRLFRKGLFRIDQFPFHQPALQIRIRDHVFRTIRFGKQALGKQPFKNDALFCFLLQVSPVEFFLSGIFFLLFGVGFFLGGNSLFAVVLLIRRIVIFFVVFLFLGISRGGRVFFLLPGFFGVL